MCCTTMRSMPFWARRPAVRADLIVVGSKGMQRRIIGSVPNSVAHGADCAVLIAKTN